MQLALPRPAFHSPASRVLALLALACASLLSSCKSTGPKIDGVPSDLPSIPLYGQARTPPHHMARGSYPFDSNGNYVTSWAAEGGSGPGPSDYRQSSHHDEDTPPRRSSSSKPKVVEVKSTASSSKKKAVQDDPPPRKSTASSSSSKKTSTSSGSGGSTKHVVKSSDTLYSIAKKYGTTVAKIKAANGLSGDSIRDGRTLTIPK